MIWSSKYSKIRSGFAGSEALSIRPECKFSTLADVLNEVRMVKKKQ